MKIKEPIEPNGDIQIFGDDGRIAVTVHPAELTEAGMANAMAMAELFIRAMAVPVFDMKIMDDPKIKAGTDRLLADVLRVSIPCNQVMRFAANAFNKADYELVDVVGKDDAAVLGFYFGGEYYRVMIERRPEVVVPCEHDHNPDDCEMCQMAADKARQDDLKDREPK